jgi:hypothetical protein
MQKTWIVALASLLVGGLLVGLGLSLFSADSASTATPPGLLEKKVADLEARLKLAQEDLQSKDLLIRNLESVNTQLREKLAQTPPPVATVAPPQPSAVPVLPSDPQEAFDLLKKQREDMGLPLSRKEEKELRRTVGLDRPRVWQDPLENPKGKADPGMEPKPDAAAELPTDPTPTPAPN